MNHLGKLLALFSAFGLLMVGLSGCKDNDLTYYYGCPNSNRIKKLNTLKDKKHRH